MLFDGLSKVLCKGFPHELETMVQRVSKCIPHETFNNIRGRVSDDGHTYLHDNTIITVPYRIYSVEPAANEMEKLDHTEIMIFHCIYSRSYNGYIREKHIRSILSTDFPDWCIPYIVKVCDEYVVEIL
ncbi:hypothetical protein LJC55_04380 [Eubacteriales bacterium OttesenSCG-928-N14]|nr:hypothetical protein [Eubacteriales bacterium OttesenSCG-928-N14]